MGSSPSPLPSVAPRPLAAGPSLWLAAQPGPRARTASGVLAQFVARIFPPAPAPAPAPAAASTDRMPHAAVPTPSVAALSSAANPGAASDIPAADRDLLFSAITSRLRCSVAELQPPPLALRDTVLDCVQSLEQLHGALVHERGYGARIERDLLQACAALATAQAELVGTQAGERRARHEADHDSLTLLPNRTRFRARLDQALNGAEHAPPTLAVLFLDLDGFKPINDRHGHDAGDELLRIVAQRLSRSIRAGDMVCRLGGDEFACLLSNPMGREQLSQLAAKLFDAVSAPLQVGALKLTVRPSIGIAMCPTDGHTAVALLKRADTAMYRAKRRQLGFAFFDRRTDA